MIDSVCKDCQGRYPACWGSCPKYLEAKAKYERQKQAKKDWLKSENAIASVQYHAMRKFKKMKQRKDKQKGL